MGGSAGGLLMGAVANMAPRKYRVIIAQVPFVDVVTTMLDESIPLTTNEFDEWGNPSDPTYYQYMLSYSPYDRIKRKDYPAMFVGKIGRAHVCTPVTTAHLVCSLLLEKKKNHIQLRNR